jgi:hypothetical protein
MSHCAGQPPPHIQRANSGCHVESLVERQQYQASWLQIGGPQAVLELIVQFFFPHVIVTELRPWMEALCNNATLGWR